MLGRLRQRLTYANVMATIGVFLGLGGTAWAVAANSVGTAQLQDGAVTNQKIATNAVGTGKVIDHSLLAQDLKPGQLGPGPVHQVKLDSSVFDLDQCKKNPGDFCGTDRALYDWWGNYEHGYVHVGYRKDSAGWVYLQGVALDGGETPQPTIFYLPTGYRPTDGAHAFPADTCGASSASEVDVHTDGSVVAASNCLSLDGVRFHP